MPDKKMQQVFDVVLQHASLTKKPKAIVDAHPESEAAYRDSSGVRGLIHSLEVAYSQITSIDECTLSRLVNVYISIGNIYSLDVSLDSIKYYILRNPDSKSIICSVAGGGKHITATDDLADRNIHKYTDSDLAVKDAVDILGQHNVQYEVVKCSVVFETDRELNELVAKTFEIAEYKDALDEYKKLSERGQQAFAKHIGAL